MSQLILELPMKLTKMNKLFFLVILLLSFVACTEDAGDGYALPQLDANKFCEMKGEWVDKNIENYSYRLKLTVYFRSDTGNFYRKILYADMTVKNAVSNVSFLSGYEGDGDMITDEASPYCLKTIDDVFAFVYGLYLHERENMYENGSGAYVTDWSIAYDKNYSYPNKFQIIPKYGFYDTEHLYFEISNFKMFD